MGTVEAGGWWGERGPAGPRAATPPSSRRPRDSGGRCQHTDLSVQMEPTSRALRGSQNLRGLGQHRVRQSRVQSPWEPVLGASTGCSHNAASPQARRVSPDHPVSCICQCPAGAGEDRPGVWPPASPHASWPPPGLCPAGGARDGPGVAPGGALGAGSGRAGPQGRGGQAPEGQPLPSGVLLHCPWLPAHLAPSSPTTHEPSVSPAPKWRPPAQSPCTGETHPTHDLQGMQSPTTGIRAPCPRPHPPAQTVCRAAGRR